MFPFHWRDYALRLHTPRHLYYKQVVQILGKRIEHESSRSGQVVEVIYDNLYNLPTSG